MTWALSHPRSFRKLCRTDFSGSDTCFPTRKGLDRRLCMLYSREWMTGFVTRAKSQTFPVSLSHGSEVQKS